MVIVPQFKLKCPNCKKYKPHRELKVSRDGHLLHCVDCRMKNTPEWRAIDREYRRERGRKRYADNVENERKNSHQSYIRHRERIKEYKRKWYIDNKERARANHQTRRARERGNGGSYIAAEWRALCAKYDNRCLCCGDRKPLTVDHIVPLIKGGSNDISNIQPLCLKHNLEKGTKIIDYRSGKK